MEPEQALAFVEREGIVLEAGKDPRGLLPSLAEAVAGGPIRGSWWGHARGRAIFAATRSVRDSADVLVCKLAGDRITYVHRRLWPALVRLARELGPERLAALHEEHTASGKHVTKSVPFPDWVPRDVAGRARALELEAAQALLGPLAAQTPRAKAASAPRRRSPSRAPPSEEGRPPEHR